MFGVIDLLLVSMAFANPIDRALEGLSCGQDISEDWELNFIDTSPDESYRVFIDNSHHNFLGNVDETVILTTTESSLGGVVFIVDRYDDHHKYRHSERIWKYMNRKFGKPMSDDPIWEWDFISGGSIGMGSTGDGMAVAFFCPMEYSPMKIKPYKHQR